MKKNQPVRNRNQMRNSIVDALKAEGFSHVKLVKPKGGRFMAFLWEDPVAGIHESLTTTASRIRNYTMERWLEEGKFFCKSVQSIHQPIPAVAT